MSIEPPLDAAADGFGSRRVRVVIVTPVRFYREGLTELFGRCDDIDVVGSTGSVSEVASLVLQDHVEVVLLDLPVPDGPCVARDLLALNPDLRVVALAARELEDDVYAWAAAGSFGYVSCSSTTDDLVDAVVGAARGDVFCSPRVAGMLLRLVSRAVTQPPRPRDGDEPRRLTSREREIAELIAEGLSNKQIAYTLGITLSTVKNHVSNILDKLQVGTRRDVLSWVASPRQPAAGGPELISLGSQY